MKQKVLNILQENKGEFISGEKIAKILYISRNAVWKAINSLKKEGYSIVSAKNSGYKLSELSDEISKLEIKNYLKNNVFCIETFKTIDSTNKYLKSLPNHNEFCVAISEEQTEGYGRMGRAFFSPEKSGIYMSILIKPNDFSFITAMTAVSVCEAIEKISDVNPQIKWVNDIFIGDKKVCGILTEASFNLETMTPDYVIVGIGINVFTPSESFGENLQNIATSIFDSQQKDIRNKLIASVLDNFYDYYSSYEKKEFIQKYIDRSFLIGKTVTVLSGSLSYPALVLSVNDHCNLVIKTYDGEIKTLNSGEVSIRYEK